jgi:uncharacterized protein (DUF2336 family)
MTNHKQIIEEIELAFAGASAVRRGKVATHVAQLFAHGASQFSEEHVALFDDVFMRLISEIELSARAMLAASLAKIPNAPPRIIRALAFDDAAVVAAPILTQSPRLDEGALIDNAKSKSQLHLLAISKRATLGEAVTDILIDRGDRNVMLSISSNAGARLSEVGFTKLIQRADGDDELAVRIGTRSEMPRHLFLKLLALASVTVRERLDAANPQASSEIQKVVAQVSDRIAARTLIAERDYGSAMALIEELRQHRGCGEQDLRKFAVEGRFEEAAAALAAMCDVPIGVVDRAMVQERSELLLILARSLNLSWSTTKAILYLRAANGELATSEVEQCLASFERLKAETAAQVVRHHRSKRSATVRH